MRRHLVVCLEGCHGSGKTELCKQLASQGFAVLDEAFMDMPSFPSLHPQSLAMEMLWVSKWFERLLRWTTTTSKQSVLFADRSPYSAVLYTRHAADGATQLERLIGLLLKELEATAHIEIVSVLVAVDAALLWARIQARLVREPQRARLAEADMDWFVRTLDFYQSRAKLWNYRVTNDKRDDEAVSHLLKELKEVYPEHFGA